LYWLSSVELVKNHREHKHQIIIFRENEIEIETQISLPVYFIADDVENNDCGKVTSCKMVPDSGSVKPIDPANVKIRIPPISEEDDFAAGLKTKSATIRE
jgi:hypothetical protein